MKWGGGYKNLLETLESKNHNLLIKGNNLLALHSLKSKYAKSVKLIYIDPPYNTGNDSFNYNDRFNHSTWLTFMKNRLEVAREFLRDDGVIFIQCDDNEQAYLKVLCDEIFGRENFDSCITHIVKPEGRMYGNIAKTHEYILVYAKNIVLSEFNEIEKSEHKFDYEDKLGGFNIKNLENGNFRAFNSTNRPNLRFGLFVAQNQAFGNNFHNVYTERQNGFIEIYPSSRDGFDYVWRWSKEKCANELHNLCARKSVNGEYLIFQKVRKSTTKSKSVFWDKEMITQKGTQEIKALFATADSRLLRGAENRNQGGSSASADLELEADKRGTPPISEKAAAFLRAGERGGGVALFAKKENTESIMLDSADNIESTNQESQATQLFATPKPEALLKRIIEIATNEGDLVMDFFAGSGTTLAVAHKMNRRWVGIEQMDYIESITKERLKKVIDGEQGGISKAVGWQGGGEFIYAELMPLNAIYREKIKDSKDEKELEAIYQDLEQKAFLDYRADLAKMLKDRDFQELDLESKKEILKLILDPNMDYLPYGEIKDEGYEIHQEIIALNEKFYEDKQ